MSMSWPSTIILQEEVCAWYNPSREVPKDVRLCGPHKGLVIRKNMLWRWAEPPLCW